MRRFALPLVLSLAVHAGFLALLWALPALGRPERTQIGGGGSSPLSITLVSVHRETPTTEKKQEKEEWVSADLANVNPELVKGPVHAEASPLPAPPAPSPGGTTGNAGQDGTPRPAPPGPIGSAVLPVGERVKRVVYLLDHSLSMSQHGAMAHARRELAASLRALPEGTLFRVLAYNRRITPLPRNATLLVRADRASVEETIDAVEVLAPSEATDHFAALNRGLSLRPEVLFLITDGISLREADVNALRRHNHAGTVLHVVELSSDPTTAESSLARLAADTGGSYRRVHPER